MSGTKLSCRRDLLNPPFPILVITAFFVASLPVPDVVGIAIKGSLVPGCSLLPTPSRNSTTDSDLFIIAEIAFPASITLPPPIATTRFMPPDLNILVALSIISGDGSPGTERILNSIPFSSKS